MDVQSPHRIGVILVGAGAGERLNAGIPKAFVRLGGETLLTLAVRTVVSLDLPGHLVVVAPPEHASAALEVLEIETKHTGATWSANIALGGSERHFSVENGLELMPEWVETVLVHDVARPLTPAAVFLDVIHAVRERQTGVVPVLPVVDSLKRVDPNGAVTASVARDDLVRVQTPQGFPRDELVAAYQLATAQQTDDSAVFAAAGYPVTTVHGSEQALKLTTPADAELLEWMLTSQRGEQS